MLDRVAVVKPELRDVLLGLNVHARGVDVALPFLFHYPRTSNPHAAGIHVIVSGLQRGLRSLGCRLAVTGRVDRKTATALATVAGPAWRNKCWGQLSSEILALTQRRPTRKKPPMSYLMTRNGLGASDDPMVLIDDDALAPSNWKTRGGVCRPTNSETLSEFLHLQQQVNRIAHVKKSFSKIGQDGSIGPITVRGVISALAAVDYGNVYSPKKCSDVASKAREFGFLLADAADDLGAPKRVKSPKPATRPAIVDNAGVSRPASARLVSEYQPQQAGFGAALKSPLGIAALGVGALLLWYGVRDPDESQAAKKKAKPKTATKKRKKRVPKRRTIQTWY